MKDFPNPDQLNRDRAGLMRGLMIAVPISTLLWAIILAAIFWR